MEKLGKLIVGIACLAIFAVANARGDATVTVDPGAPWIGYMNVFDIPQNASLGPYPPNEGPYMFGSAWGTADLMASFAGPVLTLKPNSIGDPNPYWYIGGGAPGAIGNKIMDANMYVDIPANTGFNGITLTFKGTVLANTLVGSLDPLGNGWTSVAFIKDFASDYSSFVQTTVALNPGPFTISLATINDPTRHVQYGFETVGPDVWITDNPSW